MAETRFVGIQNKCRICCVEILTEVLLLLLSAILCNTHVNYSSVQIHLSRIVRKCTFGQPSQNLFHVDNGDYDQTAQI